MKNFKECKDVFIKYQQNKMTQAEFDKWSQENCEKCKLFIGKPGKKHCIFGKK